MSGDRGRRPRTTPEGRDARKHEHCDTIQSHDPIVAGSLRSMSMCATRWIPVSARDWAYANSSQSPSSVSICFALARVLGDDRPEIPGSHYSPPASADDLWSRITSGWNVV